MTLEPTRLKTSFADHAEPQKNRPTELFSEHVSLINFSPSRESMFRYPDLLAALVLRE